MYPTPTSSNPLAAGTTTENYGYTTSTITAISWDAAWTPPADCLGSIDLWAFATGGTSADLVAGRPESVSRCMPPGYQVPGYFYWTGTGCPPGYQSTFNILTGVAGWTMCCPIMQSSITFSRNYDANKAYECNAAVFNAFYDDLTSVGTGYLSKEITVTTFGVGGGSTVTTSTLSDDNEAVWAYAIRYKNGSMDSGGGHRLTPGQAAGIGVGSAVAFFLILGAAVYAFLVWWRRKKRAAVQQTATQPSVAAPQGYVMAEGPR